MLMTSSAIKWREYSHGHMIIKSENCSRMLINVLKENGKYCTKGQ